MMTYRYVQSKITWDCLETTHTWMGIYLFRTKTSLMKLWFWEE